jgi:predicted nucleic acid-binding protein
MKYVIDAGVAFKFEVPEIDSDKAQRLRDDYRSGTVELLAPDHFPAEIANALLVAERRGRIAKGQYPVFLAAVLKTPPRYFVTTPLLSRVTVLTSAYPVSVYDSLYVALAEREVCEFVSADDRLVRKLSPTFPFVRSLSTMP